MPRGRKPGSKGVDPVTPKSNQFRRMAGMCGLSVGEAAFWCDIAPETAQQKWAGIRGIKEEEHQRFMQLYRLILDTKQNLANHPDIPAGAIMKRIAIAEMQGFMDKSPLPPEALAWPKEDQEQPDSARWPYPDEGKE